MWRPIGQSALGLVMGFGAGVLISAVAFELVVPAITEAEEGGHWKVALALGAGALTFYFGDGVIDRMGGDKRKSPNAAGGSALALTLGIVLDGRRRASRRAVAPAAGRSACGSRSSPPAGSPRSPATRSSRTRRERPSPSSTRSRRARS